MYISTGKLKNINSKLVLTKEGNYLQMELHQAFSLSIEKA